MELIREAGFPDGVVNFLPGIGEDVGAYLVEHPWTRFIAFTGSRDVGLHILRTAYTTRPDQPGVKRVICEMGGKNAIIVDDDADLDEAVKAVILGLRLPGAEVLGVQPRDRAARELRRLRHAARRGRAIAPHRRGR